MNEKSETLFESENSFENQNIWKNILDVIEETFVKEIKIGLERPVEECDFTEEKSIFDKNFNKLHELFCTVINSNIKFNNLKNLVTVNTLLICGEHSSRNDVWTTDVTITLSKQIIENLCKCYSCKSVNDILNNNKHLLPLIFDQLRPKLLKDVWKHFPAAVSSYAFIVLNIQLPNMGPILRAVMPTTLILLDDYVIANQIIGLVCLHHIIENVTKTELSWYCDGDILYKTLEPMMYSLKPELVAPLINCLISVIGKNVSHEDRLKWTNYDDILNIWLPSIEMEQKLALRSAHMECLPLFLQSMGLSCVRWSKRILRIFEEYAAISQDRENCFKALKVFIIVTWPRVSKNFSQIIIIILKTLTDLVDDDDSSNETNKKNDINSVVECLNILKTIVPDEMDKLESDICSNENLSSAFKQYFVW